MQYSFAGMPEHGSTGGILSMISGKATGRNLDDLSKKPVLRRAILVYNGENNKLVLL